MKSKAPNPAGLLEGRNARPIVEACFELFHLKQLYRRGWLARGVPPERCESVAEHSFGVALLALLMAEAHHPELDPSRVVRMALLHDIGEIDAGDVIPDDRMDAVEKHRRERQGALRVLENLPGGAAQIALYDEYEEGRSPEARFVRQIDRLEMGFQAGVYEMQGLADLSEFFETVGASLSDPVLEETFRGVEAVAGGGGGA
jgi:putative hydrolases of HD superfamily